MFLVSYNGSCAYRLDTLEEHVLAFDLAQQRLRRPILVIGAVAKLGLPDIFMGPALVCTSL